MKEEIIQLNVDALDAETRIDKYIVSKNDKFSRSHIQKMIKDGKVEVMGMPVKSNYSVCW